MRSPRHLAALLIILACAALLSACGGDASSSSDDTIAESSGVDHESVQVIEDWADTLSSGDVDGAAALFALPTIAQNGTAPLTLTTEKDLVTFNEALPCGAKLVSAKPLGRFIAATFRLTERAGGDCGAGVGGLARTAFVIEDGKITEWRRLPNSGGAPVIPGKDGATPIV